MRLEFSGASEIAAPPERVWPRLMDHEFVASCAPGVESVTAVDDAHFKVVSGFGVGTIKVRFQLDVELSDVRPPESARISVHGKAPGSAVHVDTAVVLEPLAQDRTRLNWRAAADVHGTIASVGARLLKGTAHKITQSFWEKFAARVASRTR